MWRQVQFGFEHWAGSRAAAPIVLLGNPRVHLVSSGTLRSLRAEGFATAELVAMATAIAISIAVASGALTAGETLRALRFFCPNAPLLSALPGALPGFAGVLAEVVHGPPVFIFDRSMRGFSVSGQTAV